ncbi:CALL3-like protein, partial [Mya arenaria]
MSQTLSDTLKKAIQDAFGKVAGGKTDRLRKKGVRAVLQLIGQNPTPAEMDGYFKDSGVHEVDRDSIGNFIESHVPLKSQNTINDDIAEAFAKFDTNDAFVITKADFREILTQLGNERLTDAEAEAILDCLDKSSEHVNVSETIQHK